MRVNPPRVNLSVILIVRDEAAMLPDCLASLRPLGAQIVVCDTGSTDDTVAIAAASGATVTHFPWCDDFAAARNHALSRAMGDWVLAIDADERVLPSAVPHLLKLTKLKPEHLLSLPILNDKGPEGVVTHLGTRMFPGHRGVRYEGRIHEVPVHPEFKEFAPDLPPCIMHLGYRDEVYRARNKAQRNIKLLLESTLDKPGDPVTRLYLAQSLIAAEQWPDAIDQARVCLHLCAAYPPDRIAIVADQAAVHLVDAVAHTAGDALALIEAGQQMRQRPIAHPGFWYVVGCVQLRDAIEQRSPENAQMALSSLHRCLALKGAATFQQDAGITSWKPLRAIVEAHTFLGQFELAEAYEALLAKVSAAGLSIPAPVCAEGFGAVSVPDRPIRMEDNAA